MTGVIELTKGSRGTSPILEVLGERTLKLVRQSYRCFLTGTLQCLYTDVRTEIFTIIIFPHIKWQGKDMIRDLLCPRLVDRATCQKHQ